MDLDELSNRIEKISSLYAQEFNIKRDNDWFFLKVQEELGELTQKYLMITGRGREKGITQEEIRECMEYELADLFCQVLLIANHYDINLIKRIKEKWFKEPK
jgi:NTP pyrophosphatase (non-canonical NTP hydrolase)